MADELRWVLIILGIIILIYVVWDAVRKKQYQSKNSSDEVLIDESDALLNPKFSNLLQQNEHSVSLRVEPKLDEEDADLFKTKAANDSDTSAFNTLSKDDSRRDNVPPSIAPVTPLKVEKSQKNNDPELVISINLMADLNQDFQGVKLVEILASFGYCADKRGIYERFKDSESMQEYWFSLANAFNPGFFDLENMDDFSTPGITFFMVLPGSHNPLEAFQAMLDDSRAISKLLGGELQDSTHSQLSRQSIQYYREQIQTYQRKISSLES